MKVLLFLLPTILAFYGSYATDEFTCVAAGNFPKNCTHYFVCTQTSDGYSQTIESCPAGTMFPTDTTDGSGMCTAGANCTTPAQTTEPPTTTTAKPTTCDDHDECKTAAALQQDFLAPCYSDCSVFVQCQWNGVNYTPHFKDCPAGLHYNQTSQECDWKQSVTCAERTTTTVIHTETTEGPVPDEVARSKYFAI